MKKLALLMALIICLGCTFLVACGGNDDAQETGATSDSTTEAPATEQTPDTDPVTPDTDSGNEEPDDGEVEVGDADASKDAYADDIYSGVAPEVVG